MGEDTYSSRRLDADRYLPEQLAILSMLFPDDEAAYSGSQSDDWNGIDAWAGGTSIALRVRSSRYAEYNDVAIRSNEWDKLIKGQTRYMLYCHGEDSRVTGWKLIDLDAIRRVNSDSEWVQCWPTKQAKNGDEFIIVGLDRLVNPVVASGGKTKTTTTVEDDDFVTTTITRTTTIKRRKSEVAFQAAG